MLFRRVVSEHVKTSHSGAFEKAANKMNLTYLGIGLMIQPIVLHSRRLRHFSLSSHWEVLGEVYPTGRDLAMAIISHLECGSDFKGRRAFRP
jgi:hypothetical protein